MKNACNKMFTKHKADPRNIPCCIDVECSESHATFGIDVHPTLTATRGAQGGCVIATTSKKPGIKALAAIQGFDFDSELAAIQKASSVSDGQLGWMLGNAVTGDFVEELWTNTLHSTGIITTTK